MRDEDLSPGSGLGKTQSSQDEAQAALHPLGSFPGFSMSLKDTFYFGVGEDAPRYRA